MNLQSCDVGHAASDNGVAHAVRSMTAAGASRKRRNLLIVVASLAAGGTERVAATLAEHWCRRGDRVTLLTHSSPDADHYRLHEGVRRIALNLLWPSLHPWQSVTSNIKRTRMLRTAIRDVAPDAVISLGDQTNVRVLLAAAGLGVPVIVSERNDPRHQPLVAAWQLLRRMTYPFASHVVVQTQSVAQWARGVVSTRKVRVIPNPVRPINTRDNAPKPLERTVIAMGRLAHQKGMDLLIDAFAVSGLAAEGWELVILGDGPLRNQLRALAADRGLGSAVRFVGIVQEPECWLHQAALFVLPSRYEGFPNALIEAMSCGLPVVAFDCQSGPAEIIRNGTTGVLVPDADVGALAREMAALARDADRRAAMGKAAARDVRNRFALDAAAALWDDAIDEAIARRRSEGAHCVGDRAGHA